MESETVRRAESNETLYLIVWSSLPPRGCVGEVEVREIVLGGGG
jgi:hypothetical protein